MPQVSTQWYNKSIAFPWILIVFAGIVGVASRWEFDQVCKTSRPKPLPFHPCPTETDWHSFEVEVQNQLNTSGSKWTCLELNFQVTEGFSPRYLWEQVDHSVFSFRDMRFITEPQNSLTFMESRTLKMNK